MMGVPAIVGLPARVLFAFDVDRKRRGTLELQSFEDDLSSGTKICRMASYSQGSSCCIEAQQDLQRRLFQPHARFP